MNGSFLAKSVVLIPVRGIDPPPKGIKQCDLQKV